MPTQDIYFDHAATTPTAPEVVRAMEPWWTEQFGNPSSIYRLGQDARSAIDLSRRRCATILACQPAEILFTSGATESNNQTLLNVLFRAKTAAPGTTPHLITSAVEHHAVLHPAEWLQRNGFALTVLPVDSRGMVDPYDLRRAIRPSTVLISLMYVNNEVGTIQPIRELAKIAREHGVPIHTDAVQAAGHLTLDVNDLGVDLLSLSAHKFYGPKAVGLLYVRKGAPLPHLQLGGGQEGGRRGGTENVAGIVGLAAALQAAEQQREAYVEDCRQIRDALWKGIEERIGGAMLNGPSIDGSERLTNNLSVAIEGVQGETALLSLDMLGVAASAGSACTTGNTQPSHVLMAMGFSAERARSSLRFTSGRCNIPDDVDETVDALEESVSRIRQLAAT
ncbi:MAG: cysteine desulfurase family protein [Thermomicrobiales bacterium]